MTERGLPIVDGAPACPFVAFEDDRDSRATAPDHRHRCYAEARPAPRALAHQEAYCLSSAFPVCPTFQDWARREAAPARPTDDGGSAMSEPPAGRPMPPPDREPTHAPGTDTPPPLPPRRSPSRDWAAPPPWSADEPAPGPTGEAPAPSHDEIAEAQAPAFLAAAAAAPDDQARESASRGLAGSSAERLAMEASDAPDAAWDEPAASSPPPPRAAPPPRRASDRATDRGAAPPPRGSHARRRDEDASELFGPAWEQPRRYEAYPTLRTRVGLPSLSGRWVGLAGLLLAALVLFFAGPMILGLGGGSDTASSPTATAAASASTVPTLAPEPTAQTYVVVKNDTLSKIAKKFKLSVDELLAANPQIKNPNRIKVGDEITIPLPAPTSAPSVPGSAAP